MRDPALLAITSRRGLLRLGAAAAAGAALAACTDAEPADHGISAKVGATPIPEIGDPAKALGDALARELAILAQYDAAIPRLAPALQGPAIQIRQDHAAHRDRIAATLAGLGGGAAPGSAPAGSASSASAPAAADVGGLAKAEDALVTRYYQLAAGLTSPQLAQLVAAIMASEAQHAAVLGVAAGQAPVPAPFAGG